MRLFSISFRTFFLVAYLSFIHQIAYANTDLDDLPDPQQSSVVRRSLNWVYERRIPIAVGGVALGAGFLYYYSTTLPSDKEEEAPGGCRFYIPSEYLQTVAENVTLNVQEYSGKITGWISECYNPELYRQRYLTQGFNSFNDCYSSCMRFFNETGVSMRSCFNFVHCWSKNETNVLTCNDDVPHWWVTQKDLFQKNLSEMQVWRYVPEWFGTRNLYLANRNFTHPTFEFHYDPQPSNWWHLWRCNSQAIKP